MALAVGDVMTCAEKSKLMTNRTAPVRKRLGRARAVLNRSFTGLRNHRLPHLQRRWATRPDKTTAGLINPPVDRASRSINFSAGSGDEGVSQAGWLREAIARTAD